eukprot:jgi/Galph1/1099/GphlegSOOS_G5759.1
MKASKHAASSPELARDDFLASSDTESLSEESSSLEYENLKKQQPSGLTSLRRRIRKYIHDRSQGQSPSSASRLFLVDEDSGYPEYTEGEISTSGLSALSDSDTQELPRLNKIRRSFFERQGVTRLLRSRSLIALHAARKANKKAMSDVSRAVNSVKSFSKREFEVAKAEATQFITSPHLLFAPLKLSVALCIPFIVPFFFVSWLKLILYFTFLFGWYIVLLLIFASEVAMRPPWYRPGDKKNGLGFVGLPDYWKGVFHDPKYDLDLDYEDVEFLNSRNQKLRGWFVPAKNSTKLMVVCVHGAGRDRRAFLRHTAMLHSANLDVLLFDLSEHGLSDGNGRGFAFGVREKYDVIAAARFLREKKAAKHVVLMGTSAGASSSILAASLMPSMVDAVIAENPFTRATDLFCYHLELLLGNYLPQDTYHVARRLLFLLASRVLLFRIGQGFRDYGALDAVKNLACPILVMHGTADDIVPLEHGRLIYEASPEPKQFYEAKDAVHCGLYDKDPDAYRKVVLDFLKPHVSGLSE